jgi:hypothetical protein
VRGSRTFRDTRCDAPERSLLVADQAFVHEADCIIQREARA